MFVCLAMQWTLFLNWNHQSVYVVNSNLHLLATCSDPSFNSLNSTSNIISVCDTLNQPVISFDAVVNNNEGIFNMWLDMAYVLYI